MQKSKINMKIKQSLERDHYIKNMLKNAYCQFSFTLVTWLYIGKENFIQRCVELARRFMGRK